MYAVIEGVIQEAGSPPDFVAALRQRVRPPDGPHWLHLPILCCQAVDGNPDQGIVVAAAFELARLAADVLDDVEDADAGGALWQSMGMPQAMNVGTGLLFASLIALSRLREHGAASNTVAALQAEFARTGFRMCEGQHLDLCGGAEEQRSRGDEANSPPLLRSSAPLHRYWQVATAKSGAFFELGCRAGALLGDVATACPERRPEFIEGPSRREDITPYAEYGRHLGLLAQITNDLAGVLDEDGSSDLIRRKQTLPVIYAFSVAPETQAEHLRRAWTAAAHDAQARREVRRLVIELGAPQYIFVEAERHYRRARRALDRANGQPDALDQLAKILNLHRPVCGLRTGRPASFLSNADANLVSSKGTSRC